MKVQFFNLWTNNFCIGLLMNHRYLKQAAERLAQSGYALFSLEQQFISGAHPVTPELIAVSSSVKHTLMTEWTAAEKLTDSKQKQIARYTDVCAQDLIDSAGINPGAAGAQSIWVIVRPIAVQEFMPIIEEANSQNKPTKAILSAFHQSETDGHFDLSFHAGTAADPQLNGVLTQNWRFKRIPTGYLKLPINGVARQELVPPLIAAVVSFVSRGKLTFSEIEICQEIYPQFWSFISLERQNELVTKIRSILQSMRRKKYVKTRFAEAWLRSQSRGDWLIVLPAHGELTTFLTKLKRISFEVIEIMQTNTRQLDIEDDLTPIT